MKLDRTGLAALVRPRILILVVLQAVAGFLLEAPPAAMPLLALGIGTALVSAAGCAANHYLERNADRRMARTANRPLVTGAMTERQVFVSALLALSAGLVVLALWASLLAAAVELLAALVYLGLYTPLKSRTSTNTWVGAVPGALPLLAGAAAGGGPSSVSLMATALVFLWQLPHFFAIASMYREEYHAGGMRMLSGDDPDDAFLRRQMPMQVMSVVLVSVLPILEGPARGVYAVTALVLGGVFLAAALRFRRRPELAEARGVVRASVLYLPLVLAALVLDTSCSQRGTTLDDGAGADAVEECCDVPGESLTAESGESDAGTPATLVTDSGPPAGPADAPETDASEDLQPNAAATVAREVPFGIRPVEAHAPAVVDDGTDLPSYGPVPAFSLFDEEARPFTDQDMRGDVWIVDFIFTRCAGICVPMARAMVDMQELQLPTRYLSITVDPTNDSPDVLRGYREKWDGDAERWTLLTGRDEIITGLSEQGFTLPVQVRREAPVEGMPSIFHSGRFALVDTEGRVRGFYSHDDRLDLERLQRDVRALAGS